jgi:hypothetical protein
VNLIFNIRLGDSLSIRDEYFATSSTFALVAAEV